MAPIDASFRCIVVVGVGQATRLEAGVVCTTITALHWLVELQIIHGRIVASFARKARRACIEQSMLTATATL